MRLSCTNPSTCTCCNHKDKIRWDPFNIGAINNTSNDLTSHRIFTLCSAVFPTLRNTNPDFGCLQVALSSFACFVLVSEDNVLDAKKAFVSLALFDLLNIPLSVLPNTISTVVQVRGMGTQGNGPGRDADQRCIPQEWIDV